jgi:hypothetical protein
MPSGLSAEWMQMGDGAREISAPANSAYYILRPEAAETLFILHQLTGHPVYREWGWKMFQAIEQHCKTPCVSFSCPLLASLVLSSFVPSPALCTERLSSLFSLTHPPLDLRP